MTQSKDKFIDFGTGTDQVSSRDVPADFTPSNYTPAQVGGEGNDKISAHLNGIDSALSGSGGAYPLAPNHYVVHPSFGGANRQFATIGAAITQAGVDGFGAGNPAIVQVFPGTYTENVVMSSGVHVVGMHYGSGQEDDKVVEIIGTVKYTPGAGGVPDEQCVLKGVNVVDAINGGGIVELLGANAGLFFVVNCFAEQNDALGQGAYHKFNAAAGTEMYLVNCSSDSAGLEAIRNAGGASARLSIQGGAHRNSGGAGHVIENGPDGQTDAKDASFFSTGGLDIVRSVGAGLITAIACRFITEADDATKVATFQINGTSKAVLNNCEVESDTVNGDLLTSDATGELEYANCSFGGVQTVGSGTLTQLDSLALEVEDEGSSVDKNVKNIDFVGDGVSATQTAPGNVQVSIGAPGSSYNKDQFTLDGTDISNKYVDLVNIPRNQNVTVIVKGGSGTFQGDDYDIITDGADLKRLSWSALGLDGVLISGDKLEVTYVV
jgi:hypothetical protein